MLTGGLTHTHTLLSGFIQILAKDVVVPPKKPRDTDLDLVCVHASVGNEDFGILDPLGLVDTNFLIQQESLQGEKRKDKQVLAPRTFYE